MRDFKRPKFGQVSQASLFSESTVFRFKQLTEFQGKSIKKKTTPGYIIVKLQKIKDKEKSLKGGGSNFYKLAIVQTHS